VALRERGFGEGGRQSSAVAGKRRFSLASEGRVRQDREC
jgi:hypothetical protein